MSAEKKITKKQVKHVAKLASLPLAESTLDTYQDNLSSVLEYVSHINELKTEGVDETNQVTGLTNIFREDEVDMSRVLSQKEALANAKNVHKNYFVVGALIEQ